VDRQQQGDYVFSTPTTQVTETIWLLWSNRNKDSKLWYQHLDKIASKNEARVLFTRYKIDHPDGAAGGVGSSSGMLVQIFKEKHTLAHEFGHWLGVEHLDKPGYLMSNGPMIGRDPKISCEFANALKDKYCSDK
jgi:hypothetical protein